MFTTDEADAEKKSANFSLKRLRTGTASRLDLVCNSIKDTTFCSRSFRPRYHDGDVMGCTLSLKLLHQNLCFNTGTSIHAVKTHRLLSAGLTWQGRSIYAMNLASGWKPLPACSAQWL